MYSYYKSAIGINKRQRKPELPSEAPFPSEKKRLSIEDAFILSFIKIASEQQGCKCGSR